MKRRGNAILGQIWFDLRRLHRDRRSRFRFAIFSLAAASVVFGFLGFSRGGVWLLTLPFPIALACAAVQVWLHLRRQSNAPHSMLQEVHLAEDPLPPVDLVERLWLLLLSASAEVDRAGTELVLKTQHLLPEIEVRSRNRIIQALRDQDLWDRIDAESRVLLMQQDGGWAVEEIQNALASAELVRTLRWALSLDRNLLELKKFPHVDYLTAADTVAKANTLHGSLSLRPIAILEPQTDLALSYILRCRHELAVRALIEESYDPRIKHVADTYFHKAWVNGEQSTYAENFPVGARTIHELDDERLFEFAELCRLRFRILESLIGSLRGDPASLAFWGTILRDPSYLASSQR